MDLPNSDSWESTPVVDAALEAYNPYPTIEPILAEAVRNSEYRGMVLLMEDFIQRFRQTKLQQVKFPSLSNPYLRAILSVLASYYGLKTISIEGTRLIARRIPGSELPMYRLSIIPLPEPEDEISDNFKLIETSTNLKRQTGGASSSHLNLNQTDPRHGGVMNQTRVIEQPPILDASNFQDQSVASPTSIAQSQLMQPRASVSQLALPPHGTSASPYVAGNLLCNRYASYMQQMQMLIPPSQEPLQYQPTGTDNELLKVVASALEPSGPSTQPPSQEPLQYQPGRYSESLQAAVASALQSSQPPVDPNRTSVFRPMFAPPHFQPYNSETSTYNQFPMPQSIKPLSREPMSQPRPVAAQLPSASAAFLNQEVINVPSSSEDDETGRLERRGLNPKRGRSRKNTWPK